MIQLETRLDRILIDEGSFRAVSFIRKGSEGIEWLDSRPDHPVFAIGAIDAKKRYRLITSFEAGTVSVKRREHGAEAEFRFGEGLLSGVIVTVDIRAGEDGDSVRFGLRVSNPEGKNIIDVQYPFLVFKYDTGAERDSETLILPHGYGSGRMARRLNERVGNTAHKLCPDSRSAWEMSPGNGDCDHYPGMQFAQFMAYYNSECGIVLSADDENAGVKRFKALHRRPGMRLGISHIGDWGEGRGLGYDVLLRSFAGDWHDAADIYRDWSEGRGWHVPVHERKDIPGWLLDSPAYIFVRLAGYLDEGDCGPVPAFSDPGKCLGLLDMAAEAIGGPLAVILTCWERDGPWVYPGCFPPAGGEENMRALVGGIRERGWRCGTFSSGTRWVFGQSWSGCDRRDGFDGAGAGKAACRTIEGGLWEEDWDRAWRQSYACCMGSEATVNDAKEYLEHVLGWGMESIQLLDQNFGASVFPCFSGEHGHPPAPGRWMHGALAGLDSALRETIRAKGGRALEPVLSAEAGLNERALPFFELTELRNFPPGYNDESIPLYHYLFHECVILQGAMGNAPEPYHLSIKNAANCVLGCIPGGVLTGDGGLLDKDTDNWAEWAPRIEDPAGYFEMIGNVNALRRGEGRGFLVFGRMAHPSDIRNIERFGWNFKGKSYLYDAVFHSAWHDPGGRFGIVLANWTRETQTCVVSDARLGAAAVYVYSGRKASASERKSGESFTVFLPPGSCAAIKERFVEK